MSKKNIGSTIGVLAAVTIGATAYASTMNNLDKEDQSKKALENNVSYVDSDYASKLDNVKEDYSDEVKNTKFAESKKKDNKPSDAKLSESRNLADPTLFESSSEESIVKAVDQEFKKSKEEDLNATVSEAINEENEVEEEKHKTVYDKFVSVDALNVRNSKDINVNNVVDILYKNDKVSGTIEDGWLKTDNGYIKLDFLADEPVASEEKSQEEKEDEAFQEAIRLVEEAQAEERAQKEAEAKKAQEEKAKKEAEEAKAKEEAKKAEEEKKAQEEARKAEEAKVQEEAKKAEEAKAQEKKAQEEAEAKKAHEEADKAVYFSGWVSANALNVRDNASTNSNINGALYKGDKVEGQLKDGWLKLDSNSFVSADFLSDTEVKKPAPVKEEKTEVKEEETEKVEEVKEEKPQAVAYTGWVNTAALNVRSNANSSSNIIGGVSKGDKLSGNLLNGWLEINYNGQTGYVSADFLSDTEVKKPEPVVEEVVEEVETSAPVVEEANYEEEAPQQQLSASGQQAANIASSFVGHPYVWGASAPGGFDCSGLVYYSYAQLGVNLNRTSQAQYSNGYAVGLNNLQPGDLVFFSYGGGIDHVGMIVGYNGEFVHASNPTRGVVIDNIFSQWYQDVYVGARRIF